MTQIQPQPEFIFSNQLPPGQAIPKPISEPVCWTAFPHHQTICPAAYTIRRAPDSSSIVSSEQKRADSSSSGFGWGALFLAVLIGALLFS